jgi:hypothetical protein
MVRGARSHLRPHVRAWAAVGVPLALGILQLTHPTWADGSVSQAVVEAGAWWIPLHVVLIVGYLALALTLWHGNALARALLAAFLACNTGFLGLDGVVVGSLAPNDPATADAVWNSPLTLGLGDVTGALWCAALLAIAATRASSAPPHMPSRSMIALAFLIWVAFVASLVTPAAIVVGSLALVVAVYRTYTRRGARAGVTFGLFALAALARQHVGVEAALGMLWIALAALNDALTEQSTN